MKKAIFLTSCIWILGVILAIEFFIIVNTLNIDESRNTKSSEPILRPSTQNPTQSPSPQNNPQWDLSTATTLILTQEYNGAIIAINGPGTIQNNPTNIIKYDKTFELKNSNDKSFNIYFFEGYINLAKVIDNSGSNDKIIPFDSLKIGDNVKIKSVIDFKKTFPNNLSELTIIKN